MSGVIEIERKFLVDRRPDLERLIGKNIRQGYLALEDDVEVRLRQKGGRSFETVKGSGGLVRRELEVELTDDQFTTLWLATEGRRVVKVRYAIELGGLTAELDIYGGELEGLVTVEVEFASVEASSAFRPPDWFGLEVTEDARYKNRCLAVNGLPVGTAQ